jgi:hypothetical protein
VRDVTASYEELVNLFERILFFSASESLHCNPPHARVNGVARKDHGTDSLYSRAVDQGNQGENLATGEKPGNDALRHSR